MGQVVNNEEDINLCFLSRIQDVFESQVEIILGQSTFFSNVFSHLIFLEKVLDELIVIQI